MDIEYIPVRQAYHYDMALLICQRKHHRLALNMEPASSSTCYTFNADTPCVWRGTFNWKYDGKLVYRMNSAVVMDGFSGSLVLHIDGTCTGVLTHTSGYSNDPILTKFGSDQRSRKA